MIDADESVAVESRAARRVPAAPRSCSKQLWRHDHRASSGTRPKACSPRRHGTDASELAAHHRAGVVPGLYPAPARPLSGVSPPAAPAAALSLAFPMSDAAITAIAMTAMKIVHT